MSALLLPLLFDIAAGYPNNNVLVKSFTDGSSPSLSMVARNQFQLRLYPVQRASSVGSAPSTVQLPAGQTITFTLKPNSNLAGPAVALASGFTAAQDSNNNWYYAATVALSLTAFQAALGSGTTVNCTAEILIEDPATGDELSYQFFVTLLAPVYLGTESIPENEQFAFWSSAESDARYLRLDSGIYGRQAVAAAGDGGLTIAGLALPFTPVTFLCWLSQDGGTAQPIFGQCDDSTVSAAGFTAYFSGLTPDTLHTLNWIALPAPAAFTNTGPGLRPSGQTLTVTGTTATADLTLPGLILVDLTAATGATTLTLNNPVVGPTYVFEIVQGATARSILFPANTLQKGGGGRTYTPSGANAKDVLRLEYDGTNFLLSVEPAYS